MKLLSISISDYGKLHHYDMTLADGLNVLCRENGWGKSTLASFLKAMFYGLPKSGKRDVEENERRHYTPWQGGVFGGNLVFSCQKGTFRVERTFGDSDTFALFDAESELPSSAFSAELGNELFGIDADGFERSVYFSFRALEPDGKNDTVHAKLTGLDEVYDMTGFEAAIARLEERAKEYKKKGGGKIAELELALRTQKDALETARGRLRDQAQAEEELEGLRARRAELKQQEEALRSASLRAAQVSEIRRLRASLEQIEKEIELKSQVFTGEVPSAAALAKYREPVNRLTFLQAAQAQTGLARREQEELIALSRAFPTGAPEAELLDGKFALLRTARDTETRLRQEATAASAALESARRRLSAAPAANQVPDKKRVGKNPLYWVLFALLLLSGVGALPFGILQSLPAPLVIGGVLLAASAFVLVLALLAGKARQSAAQKKLAEEHRLAGEDFQAASSRAALVRRQQAENEAVFADIAAFLAGYSVSAADPESGLRRLSDMARDWARLWKAQREAEQKLGAQKDEIKQLLAQLKPLFACCKLITAEDGAQTALDKVKEAADQLAALQNEAGRRAEELRRAMEQAGIDAAALAAEPDAAPGQAQEALQTEQQALETAERTLTAKWNLLSAETERIPEIEETILRLQEEIADCKNRHRLLRLTIDHLQQAHDDLTTRYFTPTRERFQFYLSALGGENTPKATLSPDFAVRVQDAGISREMEHYSSGWQDLLRFCVRLALVDSLFAAGEAPFLLLDDPFTNLDGERLRAAKALLTRLSEQYQILYLVCNASRA